MRSIKNRKKRGQVKEIKYRSNREKETQKGKGISVRKNQKKKKKSTQIIFIIMIIRVDILIKNPFI